LERRKGIGLDWIGLSGWTAAAAVCVGIVALGIDGTEASYGWDWSIGTNLSGGTDGKGSMEGFYIPRRHSRRMDGNKERSSSSDLRFFFMIRSSMGILTN